MLHAKSTELIKLVTSNKEKYAFAYARDFWFEVKIGRRHRRKINNKPSISFFNYIGYSRNI